MLQKTVFKELQPQLRQNTKVFDTIVTITISLAPQNIHKLLLALPIVFDYNIISTINHQNQPNDSVEQFNIKTKIKVL